MSRAEKIKEFNNIINSFLIQISPLIGTHYHSHFERLIKINSLLPIQHFLEYGMPHREEIINKNESYFSNHNNHVNNFDNNDNLINEILKLEDVYFKLSPESQEEIWNYFQAMVIITEEYRKLL